MGDYPQPLARESLLLRGLPFVGAMVLGFAALPLLPGAESDPAPIVAAALLNMAMVGAAVFVPWGKLPSWAQAGPPIAYLVVVALLREDSAGAKSGYEVLVFLPVIWLALYGSLTQLMVTYTGVLVVFLAPSAFVDASTLPRNELSQAMFSVAVAMIIVVLAQHVFQRSRQRAARATERLQALRNVERLKDEFLVLVSHELRTPLTSIVGYSDLLFEEEAAELGEKERRRAVGAINRNSKRLVKLVDDLEFVTNVQAGKLSLQRESVDLSALSALRVENAMRLASDKGIELSLDFKSVPTCFGDGDRLAQLMDNLLSNAVKYTPEGGEIEVELHRERDDLVLEVTNTGAYISPEEHAQLFDRFSRASTATSREVPGVGVGLAIAKAIVEAHEGEIGVKSSEDAGTTFRVRLPLRANKPKLPGPALVLAI